MDTPQPPTTSSHDIKKQIRHFLGTSFLLTDGEFSLPDDASLLVEGVVDSTGVLEVILFLEEAFNISVSDAEAVPRHLDSVDRIATFVQTKLPSATL